MTEDKWLYSTWGYGQVLQQDSQKVVLDMTWGGTAYLSPTSVTSFLPITVKSFTQGRKLLTFEWKITQNFSSLFKTLHKQLNLSPNVQIYLYMAKGKLLQLSSSDSPLSLRMKKDTRLVAITKKTFTWDTVKKSRRVELLDDQLSVRKKDDGEIIFDSILGNIEISGGVYEWEIRMDFIMQYDEEEEVVVGVASKNFNVEGNPMDGEFWGYWAISCRKIANGLNEEYGERVATGDTVTIRLEYKDGKGNLGFSKNGTDLGVAFYDVPAGVYPAICLNYPKIQVSLGKVKGF